MMNLLSIIHYAVYGGPHNRTRLLAGPLAREGWHTVALLPDEPGNAAGRLREGGIDVEQLPLRRLRATADPAAHLRHLMGLRRDIHGIRSLIRGWSIDLVQINGLVNPQGAIAARLEGVPVVWHLLDTRPPMALRRLMMPLVTRLADIVMVTGRAVADVHPGTDALGERLVTFYPPVDRNVFDPAAIDRPEAKVGFGFAPDDLVLGTVANLNPQKGHEYLVRAFASVRAALPRARALVVGASYETHPKYKEGLIRLAGQLGLAVGRDIVFAGALEDTRPALAAMDTFVLASVPRSEGAPTAVQEAMMMGVPVVATDVGAVAEVVESGATGYVVPALDASAIADAALRLLSNADLRERMGEASRAQAERRFSVEQCVEAHRSAYRRALDRRGRVHRPEPAVLRAEPASRRRKA